jgi:hypothetical protein
MIKNFLDSPSYKKKKSLKYGILFAPLKTGGTITMIAYEFYRRVSNREEEDRFIGVLPERRKDPQRITDQSIMNWVKSLVPLDDVLNDRVYFIKKEYFDNSSPFPTP